MDTNLMQAYMTQRAAASHAVAGALAPKSTASPAVTGSGSSSSSSSTSATDAASTITGNDFLTLLVNELKNQDPTQPTDPNEYITQLAQVNSLEQLIQINSGIASLDSAVNPTTTTTGSGSGSGSGSGGTPNPGVVAANAPTASSPALALASTPSAASQIHKPSHGVAAQ
jgi:flagellar basal-body rod modification protein FlgD